MSANPAERVEVSETAVQDAILVLNSGSSSLKAGLFIPDTKANFAGERATLTATASGIGQGGGTLSIHDEAGQKLGSSDHRLGTQEEALDAIVQVLAEHSGGAKPLAVGHRMVHGGPRLCQHTRLTPQVHTMLEQAIHFAPLHLPGALRLVDQAEKLFPDAVEVACFDTTFHQTMPPVAKRLPIPAEYAGAGVERYGFHGLSYESLIRQLRTEPEPLPERILLAHLGSGSSLCATREGQSIDTSMGLTPAGGILMATRTGDIDPGVLFFMARASSLSIDDLEQLVNHKAGLAAIAEGTGDMQQLEETMQDSQAKPEARAAAALAFDSFATSIAKEVAALIISLGGADLLVFAGGIGEHSAPLRASVMEKLAPLGFRLDVDANARAESPIHAEVSKVPIRILSAEEDLVIASHTRRLLAG